MSKLKTKLPTDIWVAATWEEFIAMSDRAIALLAINLFCTIKGISVNGFNKCS